jgi:regulatory protein
MCGLSLDIVTKHDLHEGDEILQEEIDQLLIQEEKMKMRNRAFRLLGYRDRSIKEMEQRLLDQGFDQAMVKEVIDEFVADTTLDDQRFTRSYVHDYTIVKPRGNVFIQKELRKKGISADMIQAELALRDERELIFGYITRKLSCLNAEIPKERQKMIHRLLTRGFTSSLVYDIINEMVGGHEEH